MRSNQLILILLFTLFSVPSANAMFNTFEVGTSTINSTFAPNPATFTTISFAEEFAELPIVFVLPATNGGDECDVRIRNVTTAGFDAYCTEAPPRDGEHVAMPIQYIALPPGVTTVPSSAGPITFEAGTIDTTDVQHNCASGCGTESWALVDPSAVDPANAAIIGQIQTMENESANPPTTSSEPFLSTAIDPTQGSVDEFGLALERSEVNNGSITDNETIGWLVVENTGSSCVTLDFSTFGGPAVVPFQSIATDDLAQGAPGGDIHGPVDGWNDGCNTNEGAEFAAMCFTNTPVVLANKRTQNEDGGWLRQCRISTNEIRLTVDEDRDRDNERNHTAEGVSVLAFGLSFNTPVTLSHVEIKQLGRSVFFEWETSTETYNIGFNLWGQLNGEWRQLNKRIISSHRKDQLSPNQYSKRVKLSKYEYGQITQFGVSSVDVSGKDEFFGPFEANDSYGEQSIPLPIDWSYVKAQYEQRMTSKGYRLINGRWRKNSNEHQGLVGSSRIDMRISETGLYRVSFDDISALGLDWSDERVRHIAVTHKGKPVARYIRGQKGYFTPGSMIEFFAAVPRGSNARYIDANVYQLQIDKSLVLPMPTVSKKVGEIDEDATSKIGFLSNTLTENNVYNSLASGDPWMDSDLFTVSGAPIEKSFEIVLDDVPNEAEGRLRTSIVGGLNLPGSDPDHHIQVYVNNVLIADKTGDGFDRIDIDESIRSGVLLNGVNVVRVVLPGDTGYDFDLVNIDKLDIYFGKNLTWSSTGDDPLQFIAAKDVELLNVAIDKPFDNKQTRAYIFQNNGNVNRVIGLKNLAGIFDDSIVLPTTAMHSELVEDVYYWLGTNEQMLQPDLSIVENKESLINEDTDYIIVAHPSFINQELMDFADYKTNSGLYTEVVSWFDVVEQFGYGLSTPEALRNFLTQANLISNYQYVLLVGGHSYDYLDYLGNGSVNFIPTWYGNIDIIQQAPTDTPFVDLNADGLPQKAIGRWPVRTQEDLSAIINKTYEWQENGINASRNSLFIAGKTELNRDYGKMLDNSMTPVTKRWESVNRVFLDNFVEQEGSNANTSARQEILDRINQGVALTVFNGHASPSAWSLDSLLTSQNIAQLDNAGLPTLLMPLACYITYYETPSVDSLAHQWLFSAQDSSQSKGAVGIHGATVFSDYRENTLFANKVLKRQLENNETIGQAILSVKRKLSPWHNMVGNWGLLGDPSLFLTP